MKKVKDLKGYEIIKDGYYITTCGKLISTNHLNFKQVPFVEVKSMIDKDGYRNVFPRRENGKTKTVRLARLIATAYVENSENKSFVDHINRNRLDDRIANLRWVTATENNNNRKHPVQRNNVSKIDVIKDGIIVDTDYAPNLVKKYGFTRSMIYMVLSPNCKNKSHKGFTFQYSECND